MAKRLETVHPEEPAADGVTWPEADNVRQAGLGENDVIRKSLNEAENT